MLGVEAFVDWVELDTWPSPTCPKCGHGLLIGKKDLLHPESGVSQEWRSEDVWEPDWIYGSLAGILTCNNSECGEVVAVGGTWRVDSSRDPYEQYATQLRAKYFDPPLHLIHVPQRTPEATGEAIRDASQLLLINSSASANRLRQGTEALLDSKKVKRTTMGTRQDGSRFRKQISLHDRIVAFRKSQPEVADLLEAVKWIGNDGSHESGLKAQEVLIGARILETALKLLYETSDPELERQVKKIIKNKGIRARRS
jgi:hypothetical protein